MHPLSQEKMNPSMVYLWLRSSIYYFPKKLGNLRKLDEHALLHTAVQTRSWAVWERIILLSFPSPFLSCICLPQGARHSAEENEMVSLERLQHMDVPVCFWPIAPFRTFDYGCSPVWFPCEQRQWI